MIEDDGSLVWFEAEPGAKRGFCQKCGSSLFWKPDSGDRISIYVGCIDGASGLNLTSHIFASEKGDYYELKNEPDVHEGFGARLELD